MGGTTIQYSGKDGDRFRYALCLEGKGLCPPQNSGTNRCGSIYLKEKQHNELAALVSSDTLEKSGKENYKLRGCWMRWKLSLQRRRRLVYRPDSPVLLRLLQDIRRANERYQANQ